MDLICLKTIDAKQGSIRAIRFNVDGSYCLTCGADKKIKLWNPHKNLMLKIYGGHGNEVLDAVGSCDSSQIASCGSDKSVILWDVSTGQPLRRFRGHAGTICCVKMNEESTVAISGSHDNTVMFWDLRSRKNDPIQVLSDAKDCITSIQVTDHEILTSSVDCHTRLYDLRVGQMTSDFIGDTITYASITHDGQCTVVSCADDKIRLMDKSTGELLNTYSGYASKEYSLENCITNSDSQVLSGSATGEIWCWDLLSAKVVAKYIHTPNSVVHSLSMHPSQDMFLSASGGDFKVWGPVPEEDEGETIEFL